MVSNYDDYIEELDKGKNDELSEVEKTYGNISEDYEKTYDEQLRGLEDFKKDQTDIQNENYDFTLKQIEQQKEKSKKDYQKEQTAAYRDYKKEIDPYGVNAEQMAANGLDKSGYSESSRISAYKAYQNRVTVARESYKTATLEFDNAITQARLQNDESLAELAYNTYQQKLQLTLQKLQTKNSLLLELINKKATINSTYNSLYLDALEAKGESASSTGNTGLKIASDDADATELKIAAYDEAENGGIDDSNNKKSSDKSNNGEISRNGDYITTDYYSGAIPRATIIAGAQFGTFKNGYQPKGIAGHGAIKKTGETTTLDTITTSGEKRTVTQQIWKSDSGCLWYWEGREMQYKRLPETK